MRWGLSNVLKLSSKLGYVNDFLDAAYAHCNGVHRSSIDIYRSFLFSFRIYEYGFLGHVFLFFL